jgi:hypothetical protein
MIKSYIDIAFEGDEDIVKYFDPANPVTSVQQACDTIYEKLLVNFPEANFERLIYDGNDIGYFVWMPELLISFGVNKNYRKKEPLAYVWSKIKRCLGDEFSISLFDNNIRAIEYLKRQGMKVFAEHLTILVHTKN